MTSEPREYPMECVAESTVHTDGNDSHLLDIKPSTKSKTVPHLDIPQISSLSHVRISESATTATVTRYQASPMEPSSPHSPFSSSPSTAVNSRAPSPNKCFEDEEDVPRTNDGNDRMRWRLASGFFALFVGGWADGVTGTVMPYLIARFNLTSVLSSSLFAGTTCGYFAGTILIEFFMRYLGRVLLDSSLPLKYAPLTTLLVRSSETRRIGYSDSQARHLILIFASIVHFVIFHHDGFAKWLPCHVPGICFLGFLQSTFDRNLYFATGPKQALGFGLGIASLGSVISPLVCQTIIATGVPWYRFYYGSLLLSIFNVLFLTVTFIPTSGEVYADRQKALREHHRKEKETKLLATGTPSEPVSPVDDSFKKGYFVSTIPIDNQFQDSNESRSTLRRLLGMPYQWAISMFIFLYCGSETTTQGFMVTYLLATKHAHPKTIGYVTSGFWAGISIGRFIWGSCIPYLSFTQRKHIVHACIAISVALHFTIWFVRSYVENAIATSVIGMFYGPIFPACLAMANDILPTDVQMVAMGLISSFASLGGAVFPLIAGSIFQVEGIKSLTYVTVPLAGAMACLWTLFPSRMPARGHRST